MKRRGIRYVIPIIFIAVLVGAMVTYVLLHKNTEAEKGLDYANLIGVTGDSDLYFLYFQWCCSCILYVQV